MNGGHDLGGMHGLGPINPEAEAEEPVFHSEWERRAFGLTLASGVVGKWTIDASRHARERQHPADYLRNSYYENWLAGLEKQLIEWGLVTPDELASGMASAPVDAIRRSGALSPEEVPELLSKGSSSERETDKAPLFAPGDQVRVRNRHTADHTRAPRYVRGRTGVIHLHHRAHVYPDVSSRGTEGIRTGEHLYGVRFESTELWGQGAVGYAIYVDLWEPYLEGAS